MSVSEQEVPRQGMTAKSVDISQAVIEVEGAAGTVGGGALAVIWKIIARYRIRMWLAIALGIAASLCQIGPPVAVAFLVSALLEGSTNAALWWSIVLLVTPLLGIGLFMCSTLVSHFIAADAQRDQRNTIAQKLQRVPLGFFSRVSAVELRRLIVDDVEKIEDGIAHLIPELTAAFVGPLVLLAAMLIVDWRLGVAAALPTIAGFVLMSWLMRNGVEAMNRFNQAQAGIATTMGEVVKAIPVVKTYNNGEAAIQRADAAIETFRGVIAGWIDKSIVPSTWFFLLATSNLLLVTPLSLYLLSSQAISLPEVAFFHLGALSLSLLVSGMFSVTTRLRTQEGVVARWTALMEEPDLAVVADGPAPQGFSIDLQDVTFRYDSAAVLKGISLEIPEGSSVALVGPSGAGKTTVARLLARFWDVSAGAIRIGGVDLRDMSQQVLAETVSFVFQDVFLFTRSVADNIRIGRPDASDAEIIAAAKAARAHDFVEALPQGYETVIGSELGLSLGQKQRLSIARALVRNAPILVLDEATAFADPDNERQIQQALSALAKGKTLVVIAHRLSTIRHADVIAYIDDGRILARGTHEELMTGCAAYAGQWEAHVAARSFRLTNRRRPHGEGVA